MPSTENFLIRRVDVSTPRGPHSVGRGGRRRSRSRSRGGRRRSRSRSRGGRRRSRSRGLASGSRSRGGRSLASRSGGRSRSLASRSGSGSRSLASGSRTSGSGSRSLASGSRHRAGRGRLLTRRRRRGGGPGRGRRGLLGVHVVLVDPRGVRVHFGDTDDEQTKRDPEVDGRLGQEGNGSTGAEDAAGRATAAREPTHAAALTGLEDDDQREKQAHQHKDNENGRFHLALLFAGPRWATHTAKDSCRFAGPETRRPAEASSRSISSLATQG